MEYVQPRPLMAAPRIPFTDCAVAPPTVLAADGAVHTCLTLDREVAAAEQAVRLAIEGVLEGVTSSRAAQRRVTAMLRRTTRYIDVDRFVADAFDEWRALR